MNVDRGLYEQAFLGFSYGFRPGQSPHRALDALAVAIGMEDGELHAVQDGAPQGGGISPLMSNVYLHYVFDLRSAHQLTGDGLVSPSSRASMASSASAAQPTCPIDIGGDQAFRGSLSASGAAHRTSLAEPALRWPVDRRWEPRAGNPHAGSVRGAARKGRPYRVWTSGTPTHRTPRYVRPTLLSVRRSNASRCRSSSTSWRTDFCRYRAPTRPLGIKMLNETNCY